VEPFCDDPAFGSPVRWKDYSTSDESSCLNVGMPINVGLQDLDSFLFNSSDDYPLDVSGPFALVNVLGKKLFQFVSSEKMTSKRNTVAEAQRLVSQYCLVSVYKADGHEKAHQSP
jgi:hypothetical protein